MNFEKVFSSENLEKMGIKSLLGVMVAAVAAIVVVTGVVMIINGFTIMALWGWFVAPLLGLQPLNIPTAIGLGLIVAYMTHQPTGKDERSTQEHLAAVIIRPAIVLLIGWVLTFFL
jgi:hypothetical protein